MPGRWLLAIASLVFDDVIIRDVVQPTIADLRREWVDAGADGRERLLARGRGYLAFWSLVVVSPVAFRSWPGRQNGRPLGHFVGVLAAILFLVLSWSAIMDRKFFLFFDQLPDGAMGALATSANFAFLVGPAILTLMVVGRWRRGSDRFRLQTGEVVLASLTCITIATFLGTAGVIYAFAGIGRQGSAGLGHVTGVVFPAMRSVLLAVVSSTVCLVAYGAIAAIGRGRAATGLPVVQPSGGRRRAFAWSLLLLGVLVAVDQLLRQHHEMTDWLTVMLGPPKAGISGRTMAQRSEEIIAPLLAWGAFLSVVVFVLTLSLWRSSRAKQTHPMLTWSSRLALVAVVVGGAWHAWVVQTDLRQLRDNIEQVKAMPPPQGR